MKKQNSRIAKALLETAGDMRRGGLIAQAAHDKIAMRHCGPHEFAKLFPAIAGKR